MSGGVLGAAASGSALLLAGADRALHLYDLRSLQQPLSSTTSPLLHQTSAVALSASGEAVALASVAGHIKAQPLASLAQGGATTSSVKSLTCHRLDKSSGRCTQRGGVPFPVNALQWCPAAAREPLLASGGGDGSVVVWVTAQVRSVLQRENLGAAVTAVAWNPAGSHLLYAAGEDGAQSSSSDAPAAAAQATLRLMQVV